MRHLLSRHEPREGAINTDIMHAIGRSLKGFYQDTVEQPVPASLLELLSRMEVTEARLTLVPPLPASSGPLVPAPMGRTARPVSPPLVEALG